LRAAIDDQAAAPLDDRKRVEAHGEHPLIGQRGDAARSIGRQGQGHDRCRRRDTFAHGHALTLLRVREIDEQEGIVLADENP
jgi:hypothetical protein